MPACEVPQTIATATKAAASATLSLDFMNFMGTHHSTDRRSPQPTSIPRTGRVNPRATRWPAIAQDVADVLKEKGSDEAGHAFQSEAGHLFRSEAGRGSDLMSATLRRAAAGRWDDVFLWLLGQADGSGMRRLRMLSPASSILQAM
jgi:hypothetical protein